MMTPITVKAIIGSTSPDSYNAKVVQFMKERYADRLNIIPVYINELETFSVSQEKHFPPEARKFADEIHDSDAVLFATPEYNYSIPGSLKNAIDWLSRGGENVLKDKPAFIIGVSKGVLGTVRAQNHLREILFSPNLSPNILKNNEVYIGMIQEKLDNSENLTDEGTLAFLDKVIDNFVSFYNVEKNK